MHDILAIMVDFIKSPVVNEAFFKKYASKRFLKASIIAHQWVKEHPECYELPSHINKIN
jgi:G2/mitotic-specific cyclin 1/2